MTDAEMRNIVLRKCYEMRTSSYIPNEQDFSGQFNHSDLSRACEQLVEQGLIQGEILKRENGSSSIGICKITAKGVDIIEGVNTSDSSNTTWSFSGTGHNFQFGNHNTQYNTTNNQAQILQQYYNTIDTLEGTKEEKEEAKGLIRKLIAHPLFNTVVGGIFANLDKVPVALDKVVNILKSI